MNVAVDSICIGMPDFCDTQHFAFDLIGLLSV
jgi:hypothetical protein